MLAAARVFFAGLVYCCGIVLVPAPSLAQELVPGDPQGGNVQIFRNPRETVIVISRVGPLDKQGGSMALGNFPGQVKQALENLRGTAIRAGVLPSQIVTITVFTPETTDVEAVKKMTREFSSDWNPLTAVETRPLSIVGALVEIEAVAIAREAKPR